MQKKILLFSKKNLKNKLWSPKKWNTKILKMQLKRITKTNLKPSIGKKVIYLLKIWNYIFLFLAKKKDEDEEKSNSDEENRSVSDDSDSYIVEDDEANNSNISDGLNIGKRDTKKDKNDKT